MMRRGDLDQYPVDWVVREAARARISGGIELHTSRPAVIYLKDGLIYLVLREGEHVDPIEEALDDRSYHAAVVATEIRQRAHAVEVLAEVIEVGDEGYYFHHPLNDHPLEGSWGWDPDELLAAVEAARAPEPEPAADPVAVEDAAAGSDAEGGDEPSDVDPDEPAAERHAVESSSDDVITLAEAPPERLLDLDAWRALQALVPPTLQTELVGRLGGDAAAAALVDDLCDRGVLLREAAARSAGGDDEEPSPADRPSTDDDAPAPRDGAEGDASGPADGEDAEDDATDEPDAVAAGERGGRRRRWGR